MTPLDAATTPSGLGGSSLLQPSYGVEAISRASRQSCHQWRTPTRDAVPEVLGCPAIDRRSILRWSAPSGESPHCKAGIGERHLMPDHEHIMILIPPKYAVSKVVGLSKWKSGVHISRKYSGRQRNYVEQHFWAAGHFASAVGRDEQAVRAYIRQPEKADRRTYQM